MKRHYLNSQKLYSQRLLRQRQLNIAKKRRIVKPKPVVHKICVTTVTNKGYSFLPNIINNFKRQLYPYKKLIIIFNCDTVEKEKVENELEQNGISNYHVELLPEKTQWGCNNFSISKIPEDYTIWAKMDDDDYYGKNYLMLNLNSMLFSGSYVVGRSDFMVYVPEIDKLYYKKMHGENTFVMHVAGATLFVNKKVFKKIKFDDVKSGGDVKFLKKCSKAGFKIFSSSSSDFIVVRRMGNKNHTWKINLKNFLGNSRLINSKIFKDKNIHVFKV